MADHETSEDGAHLDDVPDGCGCVELWEELSDQREANADDSE
jgi:hypothetical protein